jgi:hypothetical protein
VITVEKKYTTGDEFLTLVVSCPPLPDKVITVYLDAVASGRVNIEAEIEKATEDAQRRLDNHALAQQIVGDI